MTCNPAYSYFSTFVTHTQQSVAVGGLLDWVDIIPSGNYPEHPEFKNRNVIHVSFEDPANANLLTISTEGGESYLDTSTTLLADLDTVLADATCVDSTSFEYQTDVPLDPNRYQITESALYNLWEFVTPSNILPNTNGQGGYGYLVPAWSEEPFYCPRGIEENQYIYAPFTVDNDLDQVNQTFSFLQPNFREAIEYTADLGFVTEQGDVDRDDYDLGACDQDYTTVILEDLPYAEVTVRSKTNAGEVLSETQRKINGRGYRVSGKIKQTMEGASLKEIALTLLTLTSLGEHRLIYSIITELIYHWGSELNNLIIQNGTGYINLEGRGTLPDYVPKTGVAAPVNSRLIRETGWFCLALVSVIKNFKDQQLQHVLELPEHTELFLNHHLYFLTNWIDPGTGWVAESVNEFGITTDIKDIETVIITHLALSESLSVNYDSFIHERAVLTFNRISNLNQSLDVLDPRGLSEQERLAESSRSITSRLIFSYFYDQRDQAADLTERYISSIASTGLLPENLLEFIYLTQLFTDDELRWTPAERQRWLISNFTQEIQSGLFRNLRANEIDFCLLESCWSILTESSGALFYGTRFNIKAQEAFLMVTQAYHLYKNLWPFGYRWNNIDVEFARQGVIGSLLYTCALVHLNWANQFTILRDSQQSLSQTRAWGVDLKARSVGLIRGTLEPDNALLRRIPDRLEARPPTLEALRTRLNNLYGTVDSESEPKLTIEEPVIPTLVEYQGGSLFIEREWTGSQADLELVQNHGNYPAFTEPGFISVPFDPNDGVYRPVHRFDSTVDQGTGRTVNFTPWHAIAPKLLVTAFGYHPELKQEVELSSPYGVGLNVNLIHAINSREIWDSCVTISSLTIIELQGCGITLDDPNEALSLVGQVLSFDDSYCIIEDACTDQLELDDGQLALLDSNDTVNLNDDCYVPPEPVILESEPSTASADVPDTISWLAYQAQSTGGDLANVVVLLLSLSFLTYESQPTDGTVSNIAVEALSQSSATYSSQPTDGSTSNIVVT